MLRALIVVLLTISMVGTNIAQEDKSKPLRFSKYDLKKMTKVDLYTENARLPRMYLNDIGRADFTVMRVPTNQVNMETRFVTKTYTYDEIERMTLHNRKRKRKFGLIGGAIGAAVGATIGAILTEKEPQDDNLLLLGQSTDSGFAEPIIGGIVGWGTGFVIGEFISPVKLTPKDRTFRKRIRQFAPER